VRVQSVAVLGTDGSPEARAALLGLLHSTSFRNELADAAIAAMWAQDDPAFVAPLLATLGSGETNFTSGGFGAGLQALGYLARHEEKRDAVREFLVARVNHPKRQVQRAAIAALGELGDARAIAVLETFTHAAKDSPERRTAEKAIADIRAARKPSDDLHDLRNEVTGLQKENRELRKSVDDLKKKVEAPLPAAGDKMKKKPK
jgi:HEAT repeat protein